MTKLLLADDHDLVRETLAAYLQQQGGFDVIGARSVAEALALHYANAPFDLVMLDFSMPGMDGLAGLQRMRDRATCPVAILSGIAPSDVARRALRQGAAGFLPKTLAPEDLVAAVQRMLTGETYVPIAFLSGDASEHHPVHLTPREGDVLRGITEGKSNKEIARDLDIQEVTVKLHLKTLSRKLGARNRTHAAILARDLGLD